MIGMMQAPFSPVSGASAVEDTSKLAGWDKSRRVVILLLAAKSDVALTRKAAERQMELLLPDQDVELWEYAVLVTNSSYPAELYRGQNHPPSTPKTPRYQRAFVRQLLFLG